MNYNKQQFIENRNAGLFEWISSKGTNYQCYQNFNYSLTEAQSLDIKVSIVRTICAIIYKPLQYTFFYWTILLFFIYKFNFRHKIMKLALAYYILRGIGEIFKQIGELYPYYFVKGINNECIHDAMHPFKWLFKIELGNVFSLLGEITGDLYPLLRISEITNSKKKVIFVSFTCAIFNVSKIVLIIYSLILSPSNLYDIKGFYREDIVNNHNLNYSFIQLIVTYASVIYSLSVWIVVRKYSRQTKYNDYKLSKKFKNVSEFRLLTMEIFNVIAMLLISIPSICNLVYHMKHKKTEVDFTMEELRDFLAGIQYFMIYVDQIFIVHSNNVSSNSTEIYSSSYNNKYSTNSGKFRYENLNYSISNSDLLNHVNNTNTSIELSNSFMSDSTPLNYKNSNSDFGFLNDIKYKDLTSYDYNRMNMRQMN